MPRPDSIALRDQDADLARVLLAELADAPRSLSDDDRRRVMRMLQSLSGRA